MSKLQNRVAITGMGTICSLGHSLNEVWSNIIEGRPGISFIDNKFASVDKLPVKIAGQVNNFQIAEDLFSEKEVSRYDQFVVFALHSAHEALTQAKLIENSPYPSEKIGSIIGVGMGGMPLTEKNHSAFLERGYRRVSPFYIPAIIPNMAPGMISLKFGNF